MRRKRSKETQALLQILALSAREVESGKVKPLRAAFADIRRRIERGRIERGRARAALLARLKKQKATRAERWTRDNLCDER